MADLERKRQQSPKNIALAVFRFRARRGIGVYYTLLSTVVVMVAVLEDLAVPAYVTIVSVGPLILAILFLARFAGMKRFAQMRLAIDLFDQKQSLQRWRTKLVGFLESTGIIPLTLLPLVAAAVFVMTGSAILGSLILSGFVACVVAYYFILSKQDSDSVLPWRLEDWLAAFVPPALLLLSFFNAINSTAYLVSLLLFYLLIGVKSSYEAPQALVQVLGDKDSFSSEHLNPSRKGDVSLSELADEDDLSNLTRVGILLALFGVKEVTFTDLMLVVQVSKSSLNYSLNMLADAGYVMLRKGFKTAGGPRTFIQITDKGKDAISTHFKTMSQLASKYLS